jgi:hypothetical protein
MANKAKMLTLTDEMQMMVAELRKKFFAQSDTAVFYMAVTQRYYEEFPSRKKDIIKNNRKNYDR